MSYLAPEGLFGFGAREIAQVAGPDDGPRLTPELLVLTLDGGDRSAYTAEEIAAADNGAENMENAIARAGGALDGAARARYAIPVRLDEQLRGALLDLARYYLYEDGAPGHVEKRATAALALFARIADGSSVLAAPLATPATVGVGEAQIGIEGRNVFSGGGY